MTVNRKTIGIKNCGLNTPEAIEASIRSGADFLGFIIHPTSPRHVPIAQLPDLFASIPASIHTVCVLVNPDDTTLRTLLDHARPHLLQLHGDETIDRVADIKQRTQLPIIKAVGIETAADIAQAQTFQSVADYLLLDTKAPNEHGGTGRSFNWTLLHGVSFTLPWFLSGGLSAANVVEAVTQTQARYVDVSSGIESIRGVKDEAKIIAFNQAVRRITA